MVVKKSGKKIGYENREGGILNFNLLDPVVREPLGRRADDDEERQRQRRDTILISQSHTPTVVPSFIVFASLPAPLIPP